MVQIDIRKLNCKIVVAEDRVVLLRDLLPDHWLTLREATEARAGADARARTAQP
jgi:hypothetical protein